MFDLSRRNILFLVIKLWIISSRKHPNVPASAFLMQQTGVLDVGELKHSLVTIFIFVFNVSKEGRDLFGVIVPTTGNIVPSMIWNFHWYIPTVS